MPSPLSELVQSISLDLPERYASLVSSYEQDAAEGIDLLNRFMIKTGEDGVGLLLLSLMHHCSNNIQKAIQAAEKARFMVSGSDFFKTLSYRLRHPDGFNAWIPASLFNDEPTVHNTQVLTAPAAELDELINVLSDVENTKIRIDKNKLIQNLDEDDHPSLIIDKEVDDIYTETLASIYMKQNQFAKAKKIYGRLIDLEPEQREKWVALIAMADEKLNKG